jgi:hypothetical protein
MLRAIAWIELLGTLAGGILLMMASKSSGVSTSYGYVEGGVNSMMIMEGVALIVGGVVSFVICLALAYLCESAAAMHQASTGK